MTQRALNHFNTQHLDSVLLDNEGRLKVLDTVVFGQINPIELKVWARNNGVFHFITTEMITWLKDRISGKAAIEICAGKGTIGRALGIPSTDSYVLQKPRNLYKIVELGEEPTNPPPDVLRYEAMQAVRKFKPAVVVGAFVSQVHRPWEDYNIIPSSPFGVDEELLLQHVQTYIMFGNKGPHKFKRIFKHKHKEYSFPWLHTRAQNQQLNRVWIWNK
jgi:hypothetical protein